MELECRLTGNALTGLVSAFDTVGWTQVAGVVGYVGTFGAREAFRVSFGMAYGTIKAV